MSGETILAGFIGMVSGWIIWYLFLNKPFTKFCEWLYKKLNPNE